MKTLSLIAALMALPAAADLVEVPTVELTVSVQSLKPDKACAKAVTILMGRQGMTKEQADVYLTKPGVSKVRACLEVVFADLSSTTNGYRVHMVSSADGKLAVDKSLSK